MSNDAQRDGASALARGPAMGLSTDSRLRAWWLTTFRGYRVAHVVSVPRRALFGSIVYANTWRLTGPAVTEESDAQRKHSGRERSRAALDRTERTERSRGEGSRDVEVWDAMDEWIALCGRRWDVGVVGVGVPSARGGANRAHRAHAVEQQRDFGLGQ